MVSLSYKMKLNSETDQMHNLPCAIVSVFSEKCDQKHQSEDAGANLGAKVMPW